MKKYSQNSREFEEKSVPEVVVSPYLKKTSLTYTYEDSLLKNTSNPLPRHENPLQPNSLDDCYQRNGTIFYKNPPGILTCGRCYPPISQTSTESRIGNES